MNNKERSRNEAGKHTALDKQGLIWESRAPQLSPPEKPRQRVIAAPALSPWLNLPGATSSINPTLPVRPFQPSLLPSQPPAAFQEAPRPAAEHLPELFRGPAMRPAHPDANWLKPQTLEERHDRNAWPQGKLPEIQTLEERHNRDAWPQGKMPDPRTLEGRSDMQGLTWEDLPKAPLFPTAVDRATAEMVRQALLPGGKVPEDALLASTPPVRPAEALPQAPPPLWQGRLGADLSDKAEDITIHSRQGNGTYLTSVGGRAPQPLDEGDVAALTDLPAARLQALAAQSEKSPPAAAALLGATPTLVEKVERKVSSFKQGTDSDQQESDRLLPGRLKLELLHSPRPHEFAAKLGEDPNSLLHEYGKEDPVTSQFKDGHIPAAIKLPSILVQAVRKAMTASNHGSKIVDEVKENGGLLVKNPEGSLQILEAKPGGMKSLADMNYPSPNKKQRVLASYHSHPHPDGVVGGIIFKSEVGMAPSGPDIAKFFGGKWGPVLIVASPQVMHVLVMPDHHLRNFERDHADGESGKTLEQMKEIQKTWNLEFDKQRSPIRTFRNAKGQRGQREPAPYTPGSAQDATLRATLKAIEGRGIYYFRSSTLEDNIPGTAFYGSRDKWSSVPNQIPPPKP